MLQRLDAGATPVTPVARAEPSAAIGDTRQEAFQRSLRGMLGQPLRGEVLSRLTDGSYLVRVNGTAARMMLPPDAKLGAEVPLTLLAVEPRPTFRVGEPGTGRITVALAHAEAPPAAPGAEPDVVTLAHTVAQAEAELAVPPRPGNAQARGRADPAGAPDEAAPGEAVPAARPGVAGAAGPASLAATLLSKAPLTPSALLPGFDPGAPAPALSKTAIAIASALTRAQTASGPGAPLAIAGKGALMADPANTTTAQLAQTLHEAIGHSGLFYESHVAEWAAGQRALPELQQEPQMRQAQAGTPAAPGAPADPGLASAQLINLQLHVQEQSRVQWQGEAWPGQKMEWDIEREAGGGADGDAAEPTQWRSNVRFEFAGLGTVSAALLMVGGALQIDLRTASPESAGALRGQAGALEQALAAAGAPLTALSIGRQRPDQAGAPGAGDHAR
jgi:hypothetical protein